MEKFVTMPNDEGGEDDERTEIRLQRIVNLNGFMLGELLAIPEDFLLQDYLYEDRAPNNQQGGKYLGNQHADIDRFYLDTAMVIVSKNALSEFLLRRSHTAANFRKFLKRLQELFTQLNDNREIRDLIVQSCEKHLAVKYPTTKVQDSFFGHIATAAVTISDQKLFQSAVRAVAIVFDREVFFTIGKTLHQRSAFITEADLNEVFDGITELHKFWRRLQQFRRGFLESNPGRSSESQVQHLATWTEERLAQALAKIEAAYPEDVTALIEIVVEYEEKMFNDFVKPFITKSIKNPAFGNALGVEVLSCCQTSKNPRTRLLPLVLDAGLSIFEVERYSSSKKLAQSPDYFPYSSWPDCLGEADKAKRDSGVIVALYRLFIESERTTEAAGLLDTIQSQMNGIAELELDRIVIPLLEQFMAVLDLSSPLVQNFYTTAILTHTRRIVKSEPETPVDWSRSSEITRWHDTQTACPDCSALKEFMLDPQNQSRTFSGLEDPQHLYYTVSSMCDSSLNRSVSPATVVVTKTLRTFEKSHKEWEQRVAAAQKAYHLLPQQQLKQCLGERYHEVMTLQAVKLGQPAAIEHSKSSAESEHGFQNDGYTSPPIDGTATATSRKRGRHPEDGQNGTGKKSK